jgi:hypothetical protein
MSRVARASMAAAATIVGATLTDGCLVVAVQAGPTVSNQADTAPSSAPTPTPSRRGEVRHDLDADQITPPATRPSGDAAATAQLTHAGHGASQSQIGSPAAGRNPRVADIKGHDRCDAAAPGPKPAECDRILDRRADEFAGDSPDRTPSTVDPDATSSDLVNGIVSGGTGTVVQLPPK